MHTTRREFDAAGCAAGGALATLAILIALSLTMVAARAATIACGTDRFAVRADSTRTWTEDDPPTTADSISWFTGPNMADATPFRRTAEGTEVKFSFTFSGGLMTPPGKDFVGFAPGNADLVQGPGGLMSTCITHGHGKSWGNFDGNETTYGAEWHLLADGHLTSQPAGGATPHWFSTSAAYDPICIRPADLTDVGESRAMDLAIPIEIQSFSFGHGGGHVHVDYQTAGGEIELGDIYVGGDGVGVIPGTMNNGTLRFFLVDSLGPESATDAAVSPAGVAAAIAARSANGSSTGPICITLLLSGIPVPTTDMGDGTVAKIDVDSDCWDRDAAGGRSLQMLTQRPVPDDGAGLFAIPDGWPCARITFLPEGPPGPSQGDGSVSVYGLAGTSWVLLHDWQWNAGGTRVLVPQPGIDIYCLVDASHTPVPCQVDLPVTALPPSPDLPAVLPDVALGGVNLGVSPFNPGLGMGAGGMGPSISVQPGLAMQMVPLELGSNHWQYLPLQFNVQPDPTRPWLYVGNDPSQGFAQPSYLTLHLDALVDPSGQPLPSLPIEVDLFQGPIQRSFQGVANAGPNNTVLFPPVDLGPMLAQPFTIVIGVPAGAPVVGSRAEVESAHTLPSTAAPVFGPTPGAFAMDGLVVALGAPVTTGVTPPARPGSLLALEAPIPNPSHGDARLALAVPTDARVRAAVYDLAGRAIRTLVDAPMAAGRHELVWDGRDDAAAPALAGVYFVRVQAGAATATRAIAHVR